MLYGHRMIPKPHRVVSPTGASLLTLLAVLGCDASRPGDERRVATRLSTQAATPDWPTASLQESFNGQLIQQLFARIDDGTYKNIHGVLLVRDGKLVVEKYFSGQDEQVKHQQFQRDALHDLASATKSVNSILVGIAIDQHLIGGVDEKISAVFPEYADLFADPKKSAIRLRDCLSMTTGLAWNESDLPYTDARNDHVAMNASGDPIRYLLERPLVAVPGKTFVYNSGISILLGEIIHKVSRLPADKFAERYLFGPLGITNYYWLKYPNGVVQTGGGLWLRPYDMAKIGYLYLNGGRWDGNQIVSASWVEASIQQHALDRTYGYQWWLGNFEVDGHQFAAYGAQGRGGQIIIVFPDLQLVAVFTGWNEGALGEQPYDMLRRYILPAAAAHLAASNSIPAAATHTNP
jgi:CubicO group peptidase (beta-lactamase class C family)